MCSLKSASSNHLESWAVRCSGGSVESLKEVLYKFEITNMIGSGYVYIVLYILRPTARWCPMSPNFLTRQVSRLLGLAQVSWLTAHVGVHQSLSPSMSWYFYIHSSPAIRFHSCFFFMTDVSALIRSILHLLMVSFQAWD